jgi:hypothetical protein
MCPLILSSRSIATRNPSPVTDGYQVTHARTSLTGVLPAFALVLALSLAAFARTLRNAIASGEVDASWQATGGDAVITTDSGTAPATPAAMRAIAAVPGAQHVAGVWNSTWLTTFRDPLAAPS